MQTQRRWDGGIERLGQALSAGGKCEVRASDPDVGPTITATLDDGPLRGRRIEAQVVQGRPPSTIDAQADDGSVFRYCLATWSQGGPSAVYTFLYRV
jgi:hypothetical protein